MSYYKITLRSGAIINGKKNKYVGYHSSGNLFSFQENENDKYPVLVVPTANISMVERVNE
jgi:hypothetical protein